VSWCWLVWGRFMLIEFITKVWLTYKTCNIQTCQLKLLTGKYVSRKTRWPETTPLHFCEFDEKEDNYISGYLMKNNKTQFLKSSKIKHVRQRKSECRRLLSKLFWDTAGLLFRAWTRTHSLMESPRTPDHVQWNAFPERNRNCYISYV